METYSGEGMSEPVAWKHKLSFCAMQRCVHIKPYMLEPDSETEESDTEKQPGAKTDISPPLMEAGLHSLFWRWGSHSELLPHFHYIILAWLSSTRLCLLHFSYLEIGTLFHTWSDEITEAVHSDHMTTTNSKCVTDLKWKHTYRKKYWL